MTAGHWTNPLFWGKMVKSSSCKIEPLALRRGKGEEAGGEVDMIRQSRFYDEPCRAQSAELWTIMLISLLTLRCQSQ